jgi:F0F1-type ATP synthase membrane subunit b/b'
MNGFELFLPFILISLSVFVTVLLYFIWIEKKEKAKQLEERIKQLEEKLDYADS